MDMDLFPQQHDQNQLERDHVGAIEVIRHASCGGGHAYYDRNGTIHR